MTKPIKIGMVVPFTGPPALRVNGPMMHAGTAACISLYNEQGGHHGRPVELIVEDSAYDIEVTASAFRKLVEEDEVVALLNTNGTPQITAAMPYLRSQGVPLLLPFGGADEWFQPPQWGVYGVQAPFNDFGHLLGQWVARDGHKRVTVLHPHYPEVMPLMAQQSCSVFSEVCANDASIECVEVQLGCTDGTAMADAILSRKPDAIIVLVNWPELIAVTQELQRRGHNIPLYSWSANVTQSTAARGGDLLDGMKGYASIIVGPESSTPAVDTYRSAMARFFPDQPPDFMSLTAFAHTRLFTHALDLIEGKADTSQIVAAFERLDAQETGILPPVTFTPKRHMGVSAVQPMQLKGGIWMPTGDTETLPLELLRYETTE
ncbi:ABC transporter substrate-binding protein [Microbulbifer pacificus]|uniref:ABC transporter substrate-binding protein n=1 Tax=Microbulbifer pacificus TaxID=407164 RepID=A0AAU0N1V6_9GAMM|nr:ABC transporter substrate-binding protein [Microbulbifer pacificus]WOX07014.1 ABC transporter substrate-binding protein [Microbulbifer pacificus]